MKKFRHRICQKQIVLSLDNLMLWVTYTYTFNSVCNEVAFNENLTIMKENPCTKYFPFTYKYITLNEKLYILKENLHIFLFVIGGVECMSLRVCRARRLLLSPIHFIFGFNNLSNGMDASLPTMIKNKTASLLVMQ